MANFERFPDYSSLLGQAETALVKVDSEATAIATWLFSMDHRIGLPHKGMGLGRPGRRMSREQNLSVEEWLKGGYWGVVIGSTNVTGIRYDQQNFNLYVAFTSRGFAPSRLYKYEMIDHNVAEGLFLSDSLGTYVWDRFRRAGKKGIKLSLS